MKENNLVIIIIYFGENNTNTLNFFITLVELFLKDFSRMLSIYCTVETFKVPTEGWVKNFLGLLIFYIKQLVNELHIGM